MPKTTLDFTASLASLLNTDSFNFSNQDNNKLIRRILAVSEGIHNCIEFQGEDIKASVTASRQKKKDLYKGQYYPVPIILDHSESFLDKIGATIDMQYSETSKAAIADIYLWENTPIQKEAAERVRQDPENTFFSIRCRGSIVEPSEEAENKGAWARITDIELIHIAIVNEPADENARILESLGFSDPQLKPTDSTPKQPENTEDPDINLNTDIVHKDLHMDTPKAQDPTPAPPKVEDQGLDTELTAAKQKLATLEQSNKELTETVTKLRADLKTIDAKIPIIAEILSIDQSVDKPFLYSLSKEQLDKLVLILQSHNIKVTESKDLIQDSTTDLTTEKSHNPSYDNSNETKESKDDDDLSLIELSRKYYGEVD